VKCVNDSSTQRTKKQGGSKTCQPCAAGSFSANGGEFCETCAKHMFAKDKGQVACNKCPPGQTNDQTFTGLFVCCCYCFCCGGGGGGGDGDGVYIVQWFTI
jgi:hypothetical protein